VPDNRDLCNGDENSLSLWIVTATPFLIGNFGHTKERFTSKFRTHFRSFIHNRMRKINELCLKYTTRTDETNNPAKATVDHGGMLRGLVGGHTGEH